MSDIIQRGEVSLIELLVYFTSFWKPILFSAIGVGIWGTLVGITTPEYYTSVTKIVAESNTAAPPSFEIPGVIESVDLSPKALGAGSFSSIINSSPFLLELMDNKVYFEEFGKELTLKQYFLQRDESNIQGKLLSAIFSLPGRVLDGILSLFETKQINSDTKKNQNSIDTLYRITPEEIAVMAILESKIRVKGGSPITIEVDLPEAEASTRLNQLVLEELVRYVVELKTFKERRDLDFIQKNVDSARKNFENSQLKLARFRDKNIGSKSAKLLTEEERLTADHNLHFEIYSELALELEKQKIELQHKTPMYSIFEPVFVPLDKKGGFNMMVIIKYSILGALLAITFSALNVAVQIMKIMRKRMKEIELKSEGDVQ